jgi:glycosyltransferase involved in cell wall biosynthesis
MKPLDYLNLCYIWLKSYPSLRRIWSGNGSYGSRTARVNYGLESVPGPDEHVFGGLVKLQDLNREFPQVAETPNILYLVSSALPYFPVRLAKMARRAGAKLIVNQNGVAYPGWHGKGWQRFNRPMKRLLEMADYVLYQSKFCRLSADLFLDGACGRNSEILYNPVDTSFFRPLPKEQSTDNRLVMLLSGSHWTPYRVLTAIDTLQLVRKNDPRVSLKIAGRFCWHDDAAEARREVFAHAEKKGVDRYMDFVGPYSQQEAPLLLNSASLLLHTKYNDPCPRLVVEAMACGLPVVYSATGGVPELVGDQAGRGIPGPLDWEQDHPQAALDLAGAVLEVTANLEQFAAAARARAVDRFDVAPWLERHRQVFTKLLS